MNKEDTIIPSLLGIPCAIYMLFIGVGSKINLVILVGVGVLLISCLYGIFRNSLLIKIVAMLLSVYLIALYAWIAIASIFNNNLGVGLVFYFPVFAWGLSTLIILIFTLKK